VGVFGWVNHNIMSLQTALAEFFAPPHDTTRLELWLNTDTVNEVLTHVKAHIDANPSDRQRPLLLIKLAIVQDYSEQKFTPMFAQAILARPVNVLYEDLLYLLSFNKIFDRNPIDLDSSIKRAFLKKLEATMRYDRTFPWPLTEVQQYTEKVIFALIHTCATMLRPPFTFNIGVNEDVISFGVLLTTYDYVPEITKRAHILARLLLSHMGPTHKDYAENLMLATNEFKYYDVHLATLLYENDPYVFVMSQYF
jgi:hypothetical protein